MSPEPVAASGSGALPSGKGGKSDPQRRFEDEVNQNIAADSPQEFFHPWRSGDRLQRHRERRQQIRNKLSQRRTFLRTGLMDGENDHAGVNTDEDSEDETEDNLRISNFMAALGIKTETKVERDATTKTSKEIHHRSENSIDQQLSNQLASMEVRNSSLSSKKSFLQSRCSSLHSRTHSLTEKSSVCAQSFLSLETFDLESLESESTASLSIDENYLIHSNRASLCNRASMVSMLSFDSVGASTRVSFASDLCNLIGTSGPESGKSPCAADGIEKNFEVEFVKSAVGTGACVSPKQRASSFKLRKNSLPRRAIFPKERASSLKVRKKSLPRRIPALSPDVMKYHSRDSCSYRLDKRGSLSSLLLNIDYEEWMGSEFGGFGEICE